MKKSLEPCYYWLVAPGSRAVTPGTTVVVVVAVTVAVAVGVVGVVVVVAVAVAVVVCCCCCAPRARARQTHPQKLTQTARARARGASPHICGKNGSPQTQPKPWYLRCFCSKRESKN